MSDSRPRPTSSLQPRSKQSKLGNEIRPWNTLHALELKVTHDVEIGEKLNVRSVEVTENASIEGTLNVDEILSANQIVSDDIKDASGNEYIKSSGSAGNVQLEDLEVTNRISAGQVVSDVIQTTTGQTFLPLQSSTTGTGRQDPFTIPFAGNTFQNMIVEGDLVQYNGFMKGNAKYLTSFAERENQSLEKRLQEYAKFPDRRIFVSATHGDDKNHGRSWDQAVKTIRRGCELAEPRTTVFVASGDYYEVTPIFVRPNVAIIGDSLRTVFLYSKSWQYKELDPDGKGEKATPVNGIDYNRRDFFHLSSGTYLYGLRFKHLEAPGYCAAFPAAMVDVRVDSQGRIESESGGSSDDVPILYSPDGYFFDNLPETGPYPSAWDTDDEHVVVDVPDDAKVKTPFEDVAVWMNDNRQALQDEVMDSEHVTNLSNEQKDLCRRDVGYIVDAIANDLELGAFYHSKEAAFRYYYKDERLITPAHVDDTVGAIRFLKTFIENELLSDSEIDFSDVKNKKTVALFDMIADTLESPVFEKILDSYVQVYIERLHVVSPGSGYTLDARIDIDPPTRPGGSRAFAVPEILDAGGGIERIRVFQNGNGYVNEYRDPDTGKGIVTITGLGQNAVLRPVFRVEAFRAWAEEAGKMFPCGNVFSPKSASPYVSKRSYKSYNGTFDATDLYPKDEAPSLVLECGFKPRQGSFSEAALENEGNFRAASARMRTFRQDIQNWGVQRNGVPTDPELRDLCFRDIGFLVDAVASDLFEGGAFESVRAGNAYFTRDATGAITSILTNAVTDQITKTANVIREIKGHVKNTIFENWTTEPDALDIIEALFDGIADTIEKGAESGLEEPSRIELNARRYIAYKLHDSNLTKWRFEGRNVRDKGWTVLDERDFTFEQRDFMNRTITPVFDSQMTNPGGFDVAYEIILTNKTSIQNVVIESARVSMGVTLSEKQFDTCYRDVGLILNAVMLDLRSGGTKFSKRAAVSYYVGNRSVLPVDQTQPTVDAIQKIKEAVEALLPSSTFSVERDIVGFLIDGIINTIQSPKISVEGRYGIQNSKAYHFYRLVMLQNAGDRVEDLGTMRVGRVELFTEDRPTVYVDGPEVTGTIVESIEVVTPGSGYNSSSPPTVVFNRGPNDPQNAPQAVARSVVEGGQVTEIIVEQSGGLFLSPPEIELVGGGGSGATAIALMGDDYARVRVDELDPETGQIQKISIVHPGSGYEVTPTVSIPPPRRLRPFVVASPYVQNCSNISGPWDDQRFRVSEFYPLPFPLDNIYRDTNQNIARRVNNYGSAGGIRIDGACCRERSPLRSYVVDAFTQVNQGGIGFLLTNLAYAQFVSTFGTFCTTHMKAVNGSFANASNSVTDFGLFGLEAHGYWTEPYTRARVVEPGDSAETTWRSARGMFVPNEGYASDILSFEWTSRGTGFTPDDTVTVQIGPPDVSSGGVRARVLHESYDQNTGKATLDLSEIDGELDDLVLERQSGESLGFGQEDQQFAGIGYKFPPTVTVEVSESDRGEPAAIANLSGVTSIRIRVLEGRQPDILSIARIHGNWYTVESVSEAKTPAGADIPGQYDVLFFPPVAFADLGFEIKFHAVSYLSTGSHVMEYVGSGITYNALPEFGGVPNEQVETRNIEPAKVFYTTSDHRGNSKVGPRFSVNQATGAIALDASSFNLQNIDGIGPFIRNGIAVGERLRELSNNVQLRSDATGSSDGQTAPTQIAVKTYVDRRAVPPPPEDYLTKKYFLQARQDAQIVPGPGQFRQQYGWTELDADDLRIEQASLRADVLTGMFVDGDTRIYGNANVGTLQISSPEEDPLLPNGALSIRVDRTSGSPKLVFRLRSRNVEESDFIKTIDLEEDVEE